MYKRCWFRFMDFISFILNILRKLNNLVSSRPSYFIFIEYLIAGRVGRTPWTPPGLAIVMRSKSPIKDWLAITGNTTEGILI